MTYLVLINGEPSGTVTADSYAVARKLARSIHRVRCDVIGSK